MPKRIDKQKVITPEIKNCPNCNDIAVIKTILEYDTMYRVVCRSCGKCLTKECGSKHRAICKWNNKVDRIKNNSLN